MENFKKQLLIQLAIALGVLIVAVGANQLVASDLSNRSTKIKNQKSELSLRTQATGSLADLKADFDKTRPAFAVLENILPAKDQLINMGKEMTDLARLHDIDMGFEFGGEKEREGAIPGFIEFSLTGESTYNDLTSFLKDIEKSPLFIKFNSIDLVRVTKTENFKILISGQVFYQ